MSHTEEWKQKRKERREQRKQQTKMEEVIDHVDLIGDMLDSSNVPSVVDSVSGGPVKVTTGGRKPGSRNKSTESFAEVIKRLLSQERSFKMANEKVVVMTQMELIVARAIMTLVKSHPFDVRLFESLMNRVDGKVPESLVSLNAHVGDGDGSSARQDVLARIAQIISHEGDISSASETE